MTTEPCQAPLDESGRECGEPSRATAHVTGDGIDEPFLLCADHGADFIIADSCGHSSHRGIPLTVTVRALA